METLIATAVLVSVLAGVAQLFTASARQLIDAGYRETALLAAQAQVESLRSRVWTYAADGAPVSDPALAPSPPGTLDADAGLYFDYLDRRGRPVDPSQAWFRRRWAIVPVGEALALEVCVSRLTPGATAAPDACLMSVRTRQP